VQWVNGYGIYGCGPVANVSAPTNAYCHPPCQPIACADGVTCGRAPDGCGGWLNCNPDCGADEYCGSNGYCQQLCTSPSCKCVQAGGAWNSDTNSCDPNCKTAACQCTTAGGVWNGHTCE
jgi:hypothetical protein